MKVSKASTYGLHALMYMVRHATSLPATVEAIAKTEDMPVGPLREVLQCLAQAGFLQLVHGRRNGYVFAKPPDEIIPMELLEPLEGLPLSGSRSVNRGKAGETADGCLMPTDRIEALFGEKTIVTAAWKDLEHRSGVPGHDTAAPPLPIKSLDPKRRPHSQESHTLG